MFLWLVKMVPLMPVEVKRCKKKEKMLDTYFVFVLKIIKTPVGNYKMKLGSSPEKCLNYYGKPTSDDLLILSAVN